MLEVLPGRGMCMPGSGTLKGGTMTGGKAGMVVVGWGRAWGRLWGNRDIVCTDVTDAGTVATLTTTGVTPTLEVAVATWGRSATAEAGQTPAQSHNTDRNHLLLYRAYRIFPKKKLRFIRR